jgi:tetratricopeptide (TPR) repeat protein
MDIFFAFGMTAKLCCKNQKINLVLKLRSIQRLMKINKPQQKKTAKEAEKMNASGKNNRHKPTGSSRAVLWGGLVIAAVSFVLYANTLSHEYALDDYPVIYGNSLTMQGVKSIPVMLKTAYWYGLDGKNDFLYRPLSLVTYAVEWEISPNNPQLGHITNVLLYALTGFLLFRLLAGLLKNYNLILPFAATLLFMAHPLHTEVVANIKSRDELLCFLFFILSADHFLKYVTSGKTWRLIISCVFFFLSLLSKESAITFLAYFPLFLFFFTDTPLRKNLVSSAAMVGVAAVYMVIRGSILTSQTTAGDISVLDNTLIAAPDLGSRLATAFYILGLYIKMLVFPHPLASDYSYPQIPIVTFTNPVAIASFLFYAGIVAYAVFKLTKKDFYSFGILFYLIPLSLVANVFFLTRSTMADRFLFVPSLGFCLVIVMALMKLLKIPVTPVKYDKIVEIISRNKNLAGITAVILLLFSIKTIARNPDWKNDYSLFSTDSKISSNSSRIHFLFANHLIQSVKQNLVGDEKKPGYLQTAGVEMREALRLYPKNYEALFGLGELYTTTKEYDKALQYYQQALDMYPGDSKAINNLGNTYFRMNKYDKAFEILNEAIKKYPDGYEGYNNIGSVYFATGQYEQAAEVYKKAISLNPNYAEALKNLGSCYGMMKQYDNAITYFTKAAAIDPLNPDYYNNIAITYQFKGDSLTAQSYFAKAQEAAGKKKKN